MEGNSFIGQLQELLLELSTFRGDDILVNLKDKHCIQLPLGKHELTNELEKIISEANKIEKEKGIFPLCQSRGVLHFEYQKKLVKSPIFILPLSIKVNRITKTVTLLELPDELMINPFLVYQLQKEFPKTNIPTRVENPSEFISLLNELGFEELDTTIEYIGNFHHHRLALMGELEKIIEKNEGSNPLLELFGEETKRNSFPLALPSEALFPYDQKQFDVFEKLESDNCVVQGPPGTGKSQIICNVIGKLLLMQNKALVVSDKRAALEVIQQKLEAKGLGDLSVITTANYSSSAFIKSLKKNWLTLENETSALGQKEHHAQKEICSLQEDLAILNQAGIIGGVSVKEFLRISKNKPLSSADYRSNLPSISSWLSHKNELEQIPKEILFTLRFMKDLRRQMPSLGEHDKLIKNWLSDLRLLNNHFAFTTFGDLKNLFEKARICHRFSTDYFKKFQEIVCKDSKRFLRHKTSYFQTKLLLAQAHENETHWIKRPSPIELAHLEKQYLKKGIINSYRWKIELKKWLRTPALDFSNALASLRKTYALEAELNQLTLKFSAMGIENLAIDLDMISALIDAQNHNEWDQFTALSEQERNALNTFYAKINTLVSELKNHFNFNDDSILESYLNELLSGIILILPYSSIIGNIPSDVMMLYQSNPSINALENQLFYSAWTNFRSKHPTFSAHNPSEFLARLDQINLEFDADSISLSNTIRVNQEKEFNTFHTLLQTPAYKLSPADKEKKRMLKAGKSLLVKEFAKQRRHKSIRELLSSDAAPWIHLLKPIWLSNPSQLASNIPLEKNYFDLSIIDEASQLLLSHSIGTLYRSKRILIAGDSQQMAPSSYFNAKDENALTVLHKASFYFKNILLHYHFRSEHPALIAYSNEHFYNNELVAFPSVSQDQMPIKFHEVKNGIYSNRTNEQEAKKVANHLASLLGNKSEKIGLVAFSETQLESIFQQLNAADRIRLLTRIDEDSIFFKALEQVQGDECDRLIISFGYAKNENGQFEMRFGPVNEKNGSKRLNVLFSRARKNIDFFASVKSEDFALSSNNSIRLLWRWFVFIEREQLKQNEVAFPFECTISQKKNLLSMADWSDLSSNANDMLTIIRTLKMRGWQLGIH